MPPFIIKIKLYKKGLLFEELYLIEMWGKFYTNEYMHYATKYQTEQQAKESIKRFKEHKDYYNTLQQQFDCVKIIVETL